MRVSCAFFCLISFWVGFIRRVVLDDNCVKIHAFAVLMLFVVAAHLIAINQNRDVGGERKNSRRRKMILSIFDARSIRIAQIYFIFIVDIRL